MFCCVRSGKGDGDYAFATGNGSIGLTADFFGNRVAAAESPRRFLLQNCPSQSARYVSDCGTLRFQTAENQGHTMLNNIYNTLINKPLRQHPRFFRRKQRVGGAIWSLLRCFEWLNSNSSVGVEAWSTMGKLLYIVFILLSVACFALANILLFSAQCSFYRPAFSLSRGEKNRKLFIPLQCKME